MPVPQADLGEEVMITSEEPMSVRHGLLRRSRAGTVNDLPSFQQPETSHLQHGQTIHRRGAGYNRRLGWSNVAVAWATAFDPGRA